MSFRLFLAAIVLTLACVATIAQSAPDKPGASPDKPLTSDKTAVAEAGKPAQPAEEQPKANKEEALVPARATNLTVELKGYSGELRIKSIVAPGTPVRQGDVIAELVAPDLEKALMVAGESLEAARWGLRATETSFNLAEASQKMRLENAEQDLMTAKSELQEFLEGARQDRVAQGELGLAGLKASIEDQEDELRQLDALYKGNDLAKESQDIVLKRARRQLDQTKQRQALAKRAHDRLLTYDLPQEEKRLNRAYADREEELRRLRARHKEGVMDMGMGEMHAGLIRARMGLREAEENLRELQGDINALKLVAPHAGLAVIGAVEGNEGLSQPFKVGDKAPRGQPIAGVIDTSKLRVTFKLPVAEVRKGFAIGSDQKVVAAGDERGWDAKVVARGVNAKDGKVAVVLEILNINDQLMPGLTVAIKS
ncbi:MAG: hypothetical protein IT462_03755 [Planctomycetes bacterium]|nr:hypothetical protein [Planctomycetota bacterium]